MIRKIWITLFLSLAWVLCAQAQRVTDVLDRGLIAVPSGSGVFCSWRKMGDEYYDTEYNIYRNGTKLNPRPLTVTNYQDASGNASARYQVEAICRGVSQGLSAESTVWSQAYFDVPVQPVVNRAGKTIGNSQTSGSSTTSGYTLNDISLADVDGDGLAEFIVKRNNSQGNLHSASNKTDFNLYECYKMDGTRLWWIDLGPNLMAGPDEQWDIIGYDWDCDGKAEVIMRGADNMIIHTATGKTINVGNMSTGLNTDRPEYMGVGNEYLLYLNGETGEPYLGWDGSDKWTPMAYPLPQFEANESKGDASVWGDLGHRMQKHYFAAPYFDGRNASIFLGRGCYTRHKMCALDVNPQTHELTLRWRWNCYVGGPWFGNGFHNFAVADVDLDGRDEIVFGSMIIDDTGFGLCTTGLGHGDAQHCGDLDPYRWGLEQFTCQEGSQGNSYWNATTGQMYYRKADGGDDGRALAGNFTNLYPGGQGRSVSSGVIGLSCDRIIEPNGDAMSGSFANLNNRIYWDGDLLDEILNSAGGEGRPAAIFKWGGSRIWTSTGAVHNNSSKCNPSAQGDILGDWREEVVLRTDNNSALRIFTTTTPTQYALYTLWHDHQYRNGMAWQCIGYNQPPHVSFFLGELEGITQAPPPLMLSGREEVTNGAAIGTSLDGKHVLLAEYGDATVTVSEGASPYIFTDNAPQWVKGTAQSNSTVKNTDITYESYTHTLMGAAFTGNMRLVKQGEGTLVLPNVEQTYKGRTEVWNGTLQFDGTLKSSPLWLNRHTTLITDGGRFMKGIRADYNATIYVGKDKKSTLETDSLKLGFGSRLVIDVYGDDLSADFIKAKVLTIEQKYWEFGPKYSAPVMEIKVNGELADGRYLIGEIGKIVGSGDDVSIENVIVEGITDKRQLLEYMDGKLYLVVETFREADTVIWNGTAGNNIWDYGTTENFVTSTGEAAYAGQGDAVLFDDSAAETTVNIKGAVRPVSVTFNNETKNYTLTGDSIVGNAPLVKNGKGTVSIKNTNVLGNTVINGGKLVATLLGNKIGQDYGSLGKATSSITINDGAIFGVNGTVITDQQFRVSGSSGIEVPSGSSLTINKGITGSGTMMKMGGGSLQLGNTTNTFSKLIIVNGSVSANENGSSVVQLPRTVEFWNGTLYDPATENSYTTNSTNFIVPEGKMGTLFADPRCAYTGTLTGSGTFTAYGTWVRCEYNGDWSKFEGKVIARLQDRSNKHAYDPVFQFNNSYGLPNATLEIPSGVDVNIAGSNTFAIGTLTGSGSMSGGSATVVIGGNDKNILSSKVKFNGIRVRKVGSGYWLLNTTYAQPDMGQLTVAGGELRLNNSALTETLCGSTVVSDSGMVTGRGQLTSIVVQKGGRLVPGSYNDDNHIGGIVTKTTLMANAGSHILFCISNNKNQATSRSYVEAATMVQLNGTIEVRLNNGYVPAAGDEITLWTSRNFRGTPTLVLPELPEGLAWDTSELLKPVGVLKVVESSSSISSLDADCVYACEVFTLDGFRLGTVNATPAQLSARVKQLTGRQGVYMVRFSDKRKTVVKKLNVK